MVLSNSLAKYRNSRISSFPRSCKKSSKFGTLENFFLAFFPPTSRQPSWTQKSTNSDSPTISNKMPVPLNHQIQLLQIQRTFRPIPKRQKRNQTKKDEKNQSFSTRISPSALFSKKNEWMRSERKKIIVMHLRMSGSLWEITMISSSSLPLQALNAFVDSSVCAIQF